jgi:N-acylneuraminate cytidylyltransferase
MNNIDKNEACKFTPPADVDLIVFDFDGVFTDNRVYVSQDGTETVVCDRRDGLGVEMLKQAGIPMLILSKERNPVVIARSEKLGLEVKTGCDDKKRFLLDFIRQKGVDSASVIYVGNDLNDLDAMETVGCSICPSDSHKKVKENATYILTSKGGNGAVRELAELLIQNKGK